MTDVGVALGVGVGVGVGVSVGVGVGVGVAVGWVWVCGCGCGVWQLIAGLGKKSGRQQFWGSFGQKVAIFGPKLRRFGRATPALAPPPRIAIGEFLSENLDLARPCVLGWLEQSRARNVGTEHVPKIPSPAPNHRESLISMDNQRMQPENSMVPTLWEQHPCWSDTGDGLAGCRWGAIGFTGLQSAHCWVREGLNGS